MKKKRLEGRTRRSDGKRRSETKDVSFLGPVESWNSRWAEKMWRWVK